MKTTLLLVALLAKAVLGQNAPVAEAPSNGESVESQERAGVQISSGIGTGHASIHDLLDGVVNGNGAPPPAREGFQYTNIRLETSTPVDMFDAAEFGTVDSQSGSWMDRLKPWKKDDGVVDQPMQRATPSVSGVSGAQVSAFSGNVAPPVDPQSEAEVLLAKQELLMALLQDTEEALAARQA